MFATFIHDIMQFYHNAVMLLDTHNSAYKSVKDIYIHASDIHNKITQKKFINFDDVIYMLSSYDSVENIMLLAQAKQDNPLFHDLLAYKEKCNKNVAYFEYYVKKYEDFSDEYKSFLEWGHKREPLEFPYTQYFYLESFQSAKEDYQKIAYYIQNMPSMKEQYFYNLALHNIICVADEKNALFDKYKVSAQSLGFPNSVSDSVSSVSISTPQWLQEASPADSMLAQTPYGLEVLKVRVQLQNMVVCL